MLIPLTTICSYELLIFCADIEPLQNNPDLEEGLCKSLLCQLRFRKVLHCVVISINSVTQVLLSLFFSKIYVSFHSIKLQIDYHLEDVEKFYLLTRFHGSLSVFSSAFFLSLVAFGTKADDGISDFGFQFSNLCSKED